MKTRSYIIELPLYVEPTRELRRFINSLDSPLLGSCQLTFYASNGQFHLFSHNHSLESFENCNSAYIKVITKDVREEARNTFMQMVSNFATIFHCAMIPPLAERNVSLSLSYETNLLAKYGTDTKAVLVAKVTSYTESAFKLYNNLFSCIDPGMRVHHLVE